MHAHFVQLLCMINFCFNHYLHVYTDWHTGRGGGKEGNMHDTYDPSLPCPN